MTKLLATMILSVLLAACSTTDSAKDPNAKVSTTKDSNPKILGPYHVEGNGKTVDEAKNDAFKKAIEQAVGVAVMTQRESKNKELVKQYILTHSAGYVERYEILTKNMTSSNPARYKVSVEVWVRTGTMVDDYALYQSTSASDIDGERAATNYRTHKDAVDSAVATVNAVLDDWPEKAYDVEVQPIQIYSNNAGKPVVQVDYNYSWSSKYLRSLAQVLAPLQDKENCFLCVSHRMGIGYYENPDDLLIKKYWFFFKTETIPNTVIKKIYGTRDDAGNRFAVKIDYLDNGGKIIGTRCHFSERTKAGYDGQISSPKYIEAIRPTESVAVEVSESFIAQLSRVEVNIVDLYKCNFSRQR